MISVRRRWLVVLALGLTSWTRATADPQLPGERSDSLTVGVHAADKNPRLAGALSVFVPGLGHIYAGETAKGGVLTGLFVAGIAAVISADIGDTHASIRPGGWAAVALVGGVYLYSLIDAPFAAERANDRQPGGGDAHLLRIETGGRVLTIDAGLDAQGAAAVIRLSL